MGSPGSYYDRLGVHPEASADEVKRAYFRAVRRHPPESDSEGFKALREAWETLRDPRARREYDSLLSHGGEIERLFAQAEESMEKEDPEAAGRALRRILVLAPENEVARARLAYVRLGRGQCEEATRHLDRLVLRSDPNPLYLYQAAQVRHLWALQEGIDPARVEVLQQEAIALLLRAIRLDPLNAEPLLLLARLHHHRDEHDQALAWIEKAVAADGVVDFQDFEALHLACVIRLGRRDFEGFERTVERIKALSPDPELRAHVGWHFARSAVEFARAGAFLQAERLTGAALAFSPQEEAIRNLAGELQDLAGVHREFDQLPEGEKYLKLLLALELQIAAAGSGQTGEFVERWTQAVDLLPRIHPEHVLGWAHYLNERCPHFCGRNRELVERMLEIGQTLAPVLRQARKAAEDPALPALLQGLAGLAHDSILDHQGTRALQHRVAHGEMLGSAAGMPAATVQKAVAALRSRYPDLARNREAWLSEVLAVAGSRAPDQGGARGACGCLFLLFLVVMLVSAVG